MKRFTQLMSLLFMAAVTQYSCINDADVAFSDESHTDSNGNLALFFEIPNENHTRSAESSGVTETGSKDEYAVKSLTVYLFDSTTKSLKDQQELKNIRQVKGEGRNIQYTADRITVNPGTYNIFAIANGKAINKEITMQDDFLNAVDEVTYSTGKIPNVPTEGFVLWKVVNKLNTSVWLSSGELLYLMLNSSSGDSCTSLLGGVISSISFDWHPAIINERDNKQKMIFFFILFLIVSSVNLYFYLARIFFMQSIL